MCPASDQMRTGWEGPFLESPNHWHLLSEHGHAAEFFQWGARGGNPSQATQLCSLIKLRVKPAAGKGEGDPAMALEIPSKENKWSAWVTRAHRSQR